MAPRSTVLAVLGLTLVGAACSRAPEQAPTTSPPPGEAQAQLENGSFTADLDGFSIHYEVHGHGPVLMTVPNSWGLSLGGLRALYRPLEEKLTLVYFDPRGMGGSGPIREDTDMSMEAVRADFHALRRHLGIAQAHAIGWSNGAINLIALAADHPEALSSAIFLHAPPRFTESDMKVWVEEHPVLMGKYMALMEAVAEPTLSDEERTALQRAMWLGEYFPSLFADPESSHAKLQEIFDGVQLSWRHADYSQKAMPTHDLTDRLADITTRCLVVAGAHDAIAPDKVRELHEGLRDSRFVLFEDSGHFAPVEEPERFREVLYEFLGLS